MNCSMIHGDRYFQIESHLRASVMDVYNDYIKNKNIQYVPKWIENRNKIFFIQ